MKSIHVKIQSAIAAIPSTSEVRYGTVQRNGGTIIANDWVQACEQARQDQNLIVVVMVTDLYYKSLRRELESIEDIRVSCEDVEGLYPALFVDEESIVFSVCGDGERINAPKLPVAT